MDRPSRSPSDMARTKVSNTCTNCRERHLKCDGGPVCSRCRADGSSCIFIASRRGYRMNARRKAPTTPPQLLGITPQGPSDTSSKHSSWDSSQFSNHHLAVSPPFQPPVSQPLPPTPNTLHTVPSPIPVPVPSPVPSAEQHSDYTVPNPQNTPHSIHLFHLFYSYFYDAHPFLLPREYLSEKLSKIIAERELLKQDVSRDVYSVQALLLFAIGLLSSDEPEKGELSLKLAINLALELGMNRQDFLWHDGQGCPVHEESWRRTWWELYIVDGHFATRHPTKTFRLLTVPADTLLPCEESEYFASQIPCPRSITEFNDRGFSSDNTVFSSYAYRIDAVRVYTKVLPLELDAFAEPRFVDDADANLVSFWLYLPDSKKRLVGKDGRFDEVLFQAHMLVYSATMLLHRGRSSLAYTSLPHIANQNSNAGGSDFLQPSNLDFHTGKTLCAADMMAKLVTIPRPMVTHSPLFNCCLALSCVVHLTAWPLFVDDGSDGGIHISDVTKKAGLSYYEHPEPTFSHPDPNTSTPNVYSQQSTYASSPSSQPGYAGQYGSNGQQQIKDRIQLQIGALMTSGKTWPTALRHMESVKLISRQVFAWSKTKQMETPMASHVRPATNELTPDLMFDNGLVNFLWNKNPEWGGNQSYDFSQINDLDATLLQNVHMQ